ncbi:MAG: transcription termination/antitermination protein NusG [[Lactobacillus] timonensis]|uniref:transcription termination/antitermination protein NusG n=1 Tax=[Lactobacillus] timonensis TaxID=1970790 RepID=UPI000C84E9C3|nr:transcription termination/antitermination protein NusG [[Lactobacillus] timonensis]MCI1287733.1 transcription termination/antitermination protein NusG [[Lactobacillus] timonensis]MCI1926046.1 transcription termination/antitermination protein NusG [[Lactobacillus] timonensis]MCI1957454.1 transcription termination/antitermination protein NusG [[Lactobacillus] timonensis]MCI1970396.1 transcription termination/antitermination protein NusG [[Lactobacillus] timonensis]MCI2006648.1 transcription t
METNEKRWYVLHTYSGYENRVKSNLLSRVQSMNMQDYIFDVVVPEETVRSVKDGEAKETVEKTFPGYVMVQMIMTDQAWYIARNTPGVTGFLGSHGGGSKPTPLLPEEVDRIMKRMGEDVPQTDIDVNVGDEVKIIAGPFADLTGKVTEVDHEKMKLRVDIDMFGRSTSTELGFNQIDSVSD